MAHLFPGGQRGLRRDVRTAGGGLDSLTCGIGTSVEYGKGLGIEFDLKDIEQPVVDWTPSPAVSSFIFYEGHAFPEWQHNAIVGTLKATEL